ncbi:filamentous hemagglutinin N-terminal domain-containing protein [Caldichromatium japonicum]|uniref:Filamentous hemagglutinin N-terminal domain-containing protein n=1 Tax=Caldichromatium japonicum TaxID=2699430 RepID=A0A6G7VEY1_9GAMM|nr:YDG domain-containing protein [Caldichromatium japonicum]QIK38534.1 filamentous hemagglutinin N-terminal domain-containing protein [Caldichromatium japonicum]
MNRAYRLVWSDRLHAFVAVAEIARARGKRASSGLVSALVAAGLLAVPLAPACAANLPTGGQITAGTGTISQSGNTLTITQTTGKMAADWQSFSIGQEYAVNFVQPSASSIALNRVLGSEPSVIQGALSANGQVFLINPNGVLFTPSAQVDVGGLVASTQNLSNADFLAGRLRFSGASQAAIRNEGTIRAGAGGTVALIAARIENVGTIDAPRGQVLLGAGKTVTLDLGGPVRIQVEEGALDALVEQGGAIRADGGLVYLTAQAADELSTAVINHSGITEARSLSVDDKGAIYLMGDMARGQVDVAGTLDASAHPEAGAGVGGGFVETSAAKVKVTDAAQVKAGHWLIDPNDFTIAASGGDITGGTLSSSLASGDVTIASSSGTTSGNGDIFVRDDVTWSSGKTLTLSAYRNIEILATIDASGGSGGQVALEYGQGAVASGNTATYSLTGKIDLQAGPNFLTKLGSDGTPLTWTVITSLGSAGDESNASATNSLQGLAHSSKLSGNYVLGADIDASGTANWNDDGSGNKQGFVPIGNSANKFTGRFDGLGHTLSGLTINRSTNFVGLFGWTYGARIGNVGLVGGSMRGQSYVGGLVGWNQSSTVTHSYATGTVTGSSAVGGLVGINFDSSEITHSYATGDVTGIDSSVGGLVGSNAGTVSNSYATGAVTGSGSDFGGLVGSNSGTVSGSFYATTDANGNTINNGGVATSPWTGNSNGTGKTAAEMKQLSTYTSAGWDIDDAGGTGKVWRIYDGNSYPLLRSFLTPLTLTPTYSGSGSVGNIAAYAETGVDASKILTPTFTLESSATADQMIASLRGTSSNQQGYDISYATRTITGTGSAANDLRIIDPITFSQGTLRLKANGNIEILTTIDASGGSGQVELQYGQGEVASNNDATYGFGLTGSGFTGKIDLQAGPNFFTKLGSDGTPLTWTVITSLGSAGDESNASATNSLQGLAESGKFSGNYVLGADIDASGTANWNVDGSGNKQGFVPIGNDTNKFTGRFDGLGHTLSGLTIDRPLTDGVGLFGATDGARIGNVGLEGGAVTGRFEVGGLVGYNFNSSTITDSYATGAVSGAGPVGGLVGRNYNSSTVTHSYATGAVTGSSNVGGLVGVNNQSSTITHSYATGDVTGSGSNVGGLVGVNNISSTITHSYATGDVTGSGSNVGGLVGVNNISSTITHSYATGAVTGSDYVGGLVGQNYYSTVTHSYATGAVTGSDYVGGLVGYNAGAVTDSFWDTTTTGQSASAGGTGLTTAQMKQLATFSGWGIDDDGGTGKVWRIYEGDSYPLLRSFLTPLTITSGATVSKTYDGNAVTGPTGFTFATPYDPSKILLSGTVLGQKNAGSYTAALYSNQQGYDLVGTRSVAYTITQKLLTVSGITANNKTYDGTTAATLSYTPSNFTGLVSGDDITATGTFTDKNVGTNKTVNLTFGGADAGNYAFSGQTTASADITPKALSLSGLTANDKTYDGTTAATLGSLGTLSGVVAGDNVSVAGTASASFADKHVGAGKTVTISGLSLTGTDAGNYTLGSGATTTASITPKALSLSGLTVNDKTYDGTTAATLGSLGTLSGVVAGDNVSVAGTASASFADKHVGAGKTVTISGLSLTGTDAGNYTLGSGATTTASITPKALSLSGLTVNDKTYDGTTAATLGSLGTLSGVVAGDNVSVAGTASASFADKHVGAGKTVTISGLSLTGTDAGNYTLGSGATTTASITPKALSLSGLTANDKTYDGTTAATLGSLGTLSGVVAGDNVSVAGTASASFADKHVGAGKTVTISGLSLTGTDAGNYTLGSGATTTASITPKALTAIYTAANKVYDGGTSATVSAASSDIITGDSVSISANGAFADKHVGTGKTVNITGGALSGADAGNYALQNTTGTASADITPKALSLSGLTANDKTYDGTTAATLGSLGTLSGVVAGDNVSVAGTASASFADKHVGAGKTVTISGLSLTGTDAGNYTLGSGATTTASITPKALTAIYTAANKVYDGGTSATVSAASSDIITGDSVSISANGAFADKNAGTGKTVNITGGALSGTDAGNYALQNTTGTASADITPKALSLSGLTVNDKTYDGTTAATLGSLGTLSGVVAGDNVSVAGTASASFADKHVGAGKTVTISGLSLTGTDAGNYTLGSGATTTASITPKALTAIYTAANKVYDGGTSATVSAASSDIITGDSVSISANGAFADKHVGTGKTVNITGGALSGADAGNYALQNTTGTASADITPKALSLSGLTANDKTYDGTTAATLGSLGTLSGVVAGDNVSVAGTASASFADKHVGAGKTVTISGLSLTGTDAGNYTLGSGATTTASITPKALTAIYTAANKVYDGGTSATVSAASGDIITGDVVSITANGAFADKNVGNGKTVNITGGALSGTDAGNYALQNTTGTASADITPRPVTVTADAKSKTEGQSDPPLTYTTGCGTASSDCGLVAGETLTGSLTRVAGEAVGSYAIQQGTVTDANNPNYAITYVGADLTITAAGGSTGGGSTGGGSTGGGSTGGGSTGGGSTGDGSTGDGSTGDGSTGDGSAGSGSAGSGSAGGGSTGGTGYEAALASIQAGAANATGGLTGGGSTGGLTGQAMQPAQGEARELGNLPTTLASVAGSGKVVLGSVRIEGTGIRLPEGILPDDDEVRRR